MDNLREQRPPLGETQTIEVSRGEWDNDLVDYGETATVEYERRADAWYVKTPENDEFWAFAQEQARDVDVRQLINKKWCARYNPDPDPLDDRS